MGMLEEPEYMWRQGNLLEKPLPSSEESERVILGAVLLDNAVMAVAITRLKPEDFYSPLNRRVFSAMISLFDQSKQIDPILIGEELKKEGSFESIGGITTITNLTFGLPRFSDIEEYIKVVRNKATLRNIVRTCNRITSHALSEEEDAQVVLEQGESAIYALYDRDQTTAAVMMSTEVGLAIESAKKRSESGSMIIGIPCGFQKLDEQLQGYRPGQYIVTAARPSIGKTAIAVRRLYNIATQAKAPVFLFSIEMSKEEIADRIICAEVNLDSYALRAGNLTPEEWAKAEMVRQNLTEAAGFFINDNPICTTRTIRTELRRANSILRKKGQKIEFFVADHIGLMRNAVDKRGRTREGEVSDISKDLKAIAREFQCTGNALSQLNRQSENRADHRPMMSDLRESGSIEQDADVVELLYREDQYQSDPTLYTNIAEVIIGKNRNGPTGSVKMYFTRKSARFSDLSEPIESTGQFFTGNDNILL